MRSCYRSKWKLFADSDQLVPGRYYFSPPGTPFYADGPHAFGSRNWCSKEWELIQGIGEQIDSDRQWDDGRLPNLQIKTQSFGSIACLRDGEVFAESIDAADLVDGFAPACIVNQNPPITPWEVASAIESCSLQYAYARLIEWSYDGASATIFNFLGQFLGGGWSLNYFPAGALLPAVTTAVSDLGAVVWADGTANYQQFALQACYALIGPTDQGGWSSSPFWVNASNKILNSLTSEGYIPGTPVFFCGHSYGGVASAIAAARLRQFRSTLPLKVLTYGMPHVGDARLKALLDSIGCIHLRNDTDIVTALPPGVDALAPVIEELGVAALFVWTLWLKASSGVMLDANGAQTPDAEPLLDTPTLVAFATDVLANVQWPPVASHPITAYAARTLRRCPEVEWPLTQDLWNILQTADVFGLEDDTGFILDEDPEPILLE